MKTVWIGWDALHTPRIFNTKPEDKLMYHLGIVNLVEFIDRETHEKLMLIAGSLLEELRITNVEKYNKLTEAIGKMEKEH